MDLRVELKEKETSFNDKALILYRDFFYLIASNAFIKSSSVFSLKSILSNLFQYSKKLRILDLQLLQDLILISHNLINERTLRKLASSFLLSQKVLNLFFISAQINNGEIDQERLKNFKQLGVN